MMDGRIDQQFAELFISSLADDRDDAERPSLWPLAFACIIGLALYAVAALA